MKPSSVQPSRTVVHFVANVGGGVWSGVKTLAAHHRPRWRYLVAGVHKGELPPQRAAEAARLFDGAELVRRPGFFGSYQLLPLNVAATLSKLGVDPGDESNVYHFHTGPYTPLVFRLTPAPRGGTWLASFHGARGNFGDARSHWKRALHRRCVRRMLRQGFTLAAVSERGAADCAAMYGCRPEDFHVVYNGTQEPGTQQPGGQQGGRGGELPSPRSFHVGFVGAVIPIKGWRKVVEAVAQLRARGRDVSCTIAGDGPQRDELARLAGQHGSWLRAPGHVSDPKATVFPELDALVLPSDFEGHAQVLLEALACGVPAVCSDVGGNAETIRHGQEGFLLREATAAEIAGQLERLIADPPLRQRMADSCRRRHAAMFTARHMADGWEQLYLQASSPTTSAAAEAS